MSQPVRVRYAPSPTGSPHIGNTRTALFTWLFARGHGGVFVLRIEDTDRERFVPGSQEMIEEGLRWLGLDWDEGPGKGGDYGPYVQSERLGLYREYSDQLVAEGKAYRCYCTQDRLTSMREQQTAAGLPPGYDRRCRDLTPEQRAEEEAKGSPFVIRIKMPLDGVTTFHDEVLGDISFENRLLDDFVAIKSDGGSLYNFANVVDDHLMGITHIIRGNEFVSSTPRFINLYNHFGWEPPKFAHCSLLTGPGGAKLAKRHGAVGVLEYRDQGMLPEAVFNFLSLLGWSPGDDRELMSRDEILQAFSLEGLTKHPAFFDVEKLVWMNGEYIRSCSIDRLAELLVPHLVSAALLPADPSEADLAYLKRIVPLIQERVKRLSEVPEQVAFFYADSLDYDPKGVKKWLSSAETPALLRSVADALGDLDAWTIDGIEAAVRSAGESMGASGGKVIHPVRMAVTGRTTGPGLFEAMEVLGRDRCLHRLKAAEGLVPVD
ncbi:MAG TPA: glutamate--tRNA ligase [Armatimonadota bacterium]